MRLPILSFFAGTLLTFPVFSHPPEDSLISVSKLDFLLDEAATNAAFVWMLSGGPNAPTAPGEFSPFVEFNGDSRYDIQEGRYYVVLHIYQSSGPAAERWSVFSEAETWNDAVQDCLGQILNP